jgi:hypothetical protein
VHFALNELKQELMEGKEQDVAQRLKDHLVQNKAQRNPPAGTG